MERVRNQGPQDPRLEVKRNWRDSVTPTKDSDIGERARLYKGLAEGAVIAHMALEGMSGGRGTPEMMAAQTAQIRASRREAVLAGFNLGGFDLIVKDKIALMKRKEAERVADMALVHAEFPGQFDTDDADAQARQGEVPARSDAGGFELRRRGW